MVSYYGWSSTCFAIQHCLATFPKLPQLPAMLSANDIVILPVHWDHPDSVHLRATQRTEITALGGLDPGTPPSAADIPVFLVAYCAGVPVGCGGLRPLPDNAAEIKRMFVDPAYRGPIEGDKGAGGGSIAGLILAKLEDEALGRGWAVLMLETGVFLVKVRRFYERYGYIQRGMFGNYSEADNSVCYEKRLPLPSQSRDGLTSTSA
jgi:putative acetyltransferase